MVSALRFTLLTLLLSCIAAAPAVAQSQSNGQERVGQLVYFEGSVDVKPPNGSWGAAEIEQPLQRNLTLRTGPRATAEISWQNGSKTTLGPGATQEIGALYEQTATQQTASTDGLVQQFMDLFREQTSEASEAGGVRRGPAEVPESPGPGELYWKTYATVSFNKAQNSYKLGNYATAVRQFHLFLQQNPSHTKAEMARFALGTSYLKLNNPTQAREAFQTLLDKHPDHPLADRAQTMLDRLSS